MTIARETIPTSAGYPLDDRTEDVIALLHQRVSSVHDLDRYLEDAKNDASFAALVREIRVQDVTVVGRLKDYLRGRLDGYDPSHIGEPW